MRQKLLTIVAALSLMVSAVAGVLWVRSYWRADVIQFVEYRAEAATRRYLNAVSEDGRLVVGAGTTQYIPRGPAGPGQPTFVVNASPQSQGWSFGSVPAPSPLRLNEPKSNLLGLRGTYEWRREIDGRNYRLPNTNVRRSSMFLAIPHWMAMLIGLAMPAWWWFLRRRRLLRLDRLNRGLCVSCGYDLRASPQGGRCSECGTVPAAPVTAA